MTNLRKILVITLAVLFTTANAANAWYAPDVNSSSINSITVNLYDGAENACWTNLREAREYAEEKLEIKGYNVLAEGDEYSFNISVSSSRDNGMCFGSVKVEIFVGNYRNGVFGLHLIGSMTDALLEPNNFNNYVIEVISDMIAEM